MSQKHKSIVHVMGSSRPGQNESVCPGNIEAMRDDIKNLEITQAIHDLDSKLTDLEIALKLDVHQERH